MSRHCSRPRTAAAPNAILACALLILLALPSAALAGPTVKVRIESASSTLLPLTTVTLEAPEPASGCPANSATTAINLAVNGNWDHGMANGSHGDFTETILGRTLSFSHEAETWAIWINDKWGGGICEDLLSEGDEVLVIADKEPEPTYAPTVLPLIITGAPTTASVGTPFTIHVEKIHTRPGTYAEPGEGTPEPEAGVSVSLGGASATTAADGTATLTPTAAGTLSLTASELGDAAAAPVSVCVRESGQSGCGVTVPVSGSTPTGTTTTAVTALAPYTGPFALVPRLKDIVEGAIYKHGHAPRLLAGTVSAHSAVSSVSIELRRRYRGRCFAYDGSRERFVRARCGEGRPFQVSTSGSFSYLLPFGLLPGRYVLDIQASDAAGNHTTLARGSSRVVFRVR